MMRVRIAAVWSLVLGAALLAFTTPVKTQSLSRFILIAAPDAVDDIAARYNLTVARSADDVAHRDVALLTGALDATEADALVAEAADDVDVVGFEADRQVAVAEEPDLSGSVTGILEKLPEQTPTPYYGATAWKGYVRQPAASIIRTSDAQGQYGSGAGVVAIIDTGVDAHHPVFGGHVLPGYDFTRDRAGDASDLSDLDGSVTAILEAAPDSSALGFDILNGSVTAILEGSVTAILETNSALPQAFGHGTMVAGLVHLVAPTANILPLKAFRADGSSTLFEIVRAIYYATDNGARVINMSFSLAKDSRALARAIKYATDHGVLVVAAAGNARSNVNVFPAAYSNATGVASTTNLDVRSAFTNYGSSIASLAAPGEQLVTTFPAGRYAVASGTSFSSGLVSGLASLLVQNAPAIKQGDFENSLGKGSKKINQDVGQGRLDLYKTLQEYLKR